MKRDFLKYIYMLLLLPFFISLAGCSIPLPIGGDTDDILLSDDMIVPSAPSGGQDASADIAPPPSPSDKKSKDKEKEETKPDEINLSGKSAVLDIDAGGRTTPFVPYRERNLTYSSMDFGDLPLAPNAGEMDEMLSNLVTAKVTGILYDEASPSAIINVLDDDYLVKPGDKVESFEIENISKDFVAIKTGSNVYRAKVGDIVDGELYGTGVYNLGHRFAGTYAPANDEDVLIVQTKKKSGGSEKKQPESLTDLELPPAPEIKIKTPSGEVSLPVNGASQGL